MADAVAELRRELHRRGYDTRKKGHHIRIYHSDGKVVRTRKGQPLEIVEGGDTRQFNNSLNNLRQAGILPKVQEMKSTPRTTKLSKERLKQYSDTLRAELGQFMTDHKLEQTDVWHYAWYYNTQHPPLLMSSEASAQTTISRFLGKGGSLSNNGYTFLSRALSAMKTLDGDIPRAAEIRTRLTASAPQPVQHDPVGVEVEGESHTPIKAPLPELAFETMQRIYREDKDHDAILDLIHRIARLELT